MEGLSQLEAVILLLAAVIVLVTIARRVLIPYPIFLVLGGSASAWCRTYRRPARSRRRLPGLPAARPLDGGVLHLAPRFPRQPAVHRLARHRAGAGHDGSRRGGGSRAHARARLAGGAGAGRDRLTARRGGRRRHRPAARHPPPRVTVLEGESLINDASALVLYRTAIAAAVTGTFVLSGRSASSSWPRRAG